MFFTKKVVLLTNFFYIHHQPKPPQINYLTNYNQYWRENNFN